METTIIGGLVAFLQAIILYYIAKVDAKLESLVSRIEQVEKVQFACPSCRETADGRRA